MKQKIMVLLLTAVLCFVFSGCSVIGLDAQSLMNTPRPTGEKAGIHAELEKQAGAGFTLRYPSRGDYRYAIITHEGANGSKSEAIAFYQKKGESAGTNIMFIEKKGSSWKAIGSFNNPANTVDQVFFGDVNHDGQDEVVVGWGSSQNNSTTISVYYYKNGAVSETKLEQSYTEMAVLDFNGDGAAEIFTANIAVGDQPAIARLMRLKENGAEIIGTANLDPGVTKYASFSSGYINAQQKGVVLDGMKSANVLVTELLYWDKTTKTLKSPFYNPQKQIENSTKRSTTAVSKDINGDKIIEFPVVNMLPGYTPDTALDETNYLTDWYRYDTNNNNGMIPVQSVIMDYTDGYWFLIPDTRRGKITAKMDASTRTLTIYEWIVKDKSGNNGTMGAPLLRIRLFAEQYWDPVKYPHYTKIMENNNLIYAVETPAPGNPLSLNAGDIKESFRLINQD